MQPGDLVYHLEDIRTSDLGPVPGLIIKKRGSDLVVTAVFEGRNAAKGIIDYINDKNK